MDDDLAQWVRVRAAKRDVSVSKLIAELLAELREREQQYDTAMHSYLSRASERTWVSDGTYPSRDALHDRDRLR